MFSQINLLQEDGDLKHPKEYDEHIYLEMCGFADDTRSSIRQFGDELRGKLRNNQRNTKVTESSLKHWSNGNEQ